eukprot:TRINITY_DN5043_c0_g2_i1.p1 TRINITY_DN5043_c0_g2~~TRINITY_DN5043_c0_g2_i1.p1  ORF type:complete len:246 (+),score=91.86 TRINITY_DN5043_c0_g2_i1:269-1006(+)
MSKKIIALFDVDGTLTIPRDSITNEFKELLKELRKKIKIGVVGGSDLPKQKEQLGEDALENFDYNFPENGVIGFRNGKQFHNKSIREYLGEERLKKFLNFCLHYVADLDIPIKRGTFVEFRQTMLNISPIGRNCSVPERIEFEKYDKEHKIRENFVKALKENFGDFNLKYSIGGQISFDVFPQGWDKTYCLQHLEEEKFDEIHFFGDKTNEGENDYEIYNSEKTIGHRVVGPEDTMKQIKELFQL